MLLQDKYNVSGNDVTGATMINMAQKIRSLGLLDLGYGYIKRIRLDRRP